MVFREESWSTRDHVRLYAITWTPDVAPRGVIGLVHGLGEHVGRYTYVAEFLSRHGYALCAFDLRGHGKSAGPRADAPSYNALMDDIELLVQRARVAFPGLPFFLYGHSLGGNLVLNYLVRRHPNVSGAIITCPGLRPTSFRPWMLAPARLLERFFPSLLIPNLINPIDLSRSPEVVANYVADPLAQKMVSVRLAIMAIDAGAWILPRGSEITGPSLLLQGAADRIVDLETNVRFAENLPGTCRFKMFPGLYHEIHNEPERDEVLTEITSWIASQTWRLFL